MVAAEITAEGQDNPLQGSLGGVARTHAAELDRFAMGTIRGPHRVLTQRFTLPSGQPRGTSGQGERAACRHLSPARPQHQSGQEQ